MWQHNYFSFWSALKGVKLLYFCKHSFIVLVSLTTAVCLVLAYHIMDMAEKDGTEGLCPVCRTTYDKEKIVAMEAKCERVVVVTNKDRENKPQKAKLKKNEGRTDLSNVRVIQRKMAYIIGLPLSLADEELLLQKEYFGQYGKVSKASLSRTVGGAIQQFVNDTCSVYITYSKEEAIQCIQSIHGFVLEEHHLELQSIAMHG
ncbi:hypothetical protein ACSBR2_026727 [Camellia fascicularis]